MSPAVPERLAAAGYRAGWWTVRALPEPVVTRVGDALAERQWRRGGSGPEQLARNLARVVPDAGPAELDDLVRRGLRSYVRYFREAFRLPNYSADELRVAVRLDGRENLEAPLAAGTGVIAALPHSGNWDLGGAWASLEIAPVVAVAERLKPDALFQGFLDYRQSVGMDIIPHRGGPPVIPTLEARLRDNALVAILADRGLGRGGVPVTFFGEPALLPPGPALLAVRTGAPIVPASLWYDGPVARVVIGDPLPVPPAGDGPDDERRRVAELTQAVATAFEPGIAAHPEDWHMLQPLWVADLDPTRRPGSTTPDGEVPADGAST